MTDDFPYKRLSIQPHDIERMFKNLSTYTPTFVNRAGIIKGTLPTDILKYAGEYLTVILPPNDYNDYNNLSDYFNEQARVKCRKSYKPLSPWRWWATNKTMVRSLAKQRGDESLHNLREIQYELFKFECESFKPSNAVVFISMFGAKSVLDISAGWGDRLAACLSRGVSYTAADPNPNVHAGYLEMVSFYEKHIGTHGRVNIQQCGFEDLVLDSKYDLVITSPPYFDLEIYGSPTDSAQSIVKHNTLTKWFYGFLIPSMEKAYSALNIGGHMVINIEDDFKNKYVEDMIREFERLHAGSFMGTVVITKDIGTVGRPFFCWIKSV
jgi:hypothetical protein